MNQTDPDPAYIKVETHRSGPFVFQIGLDMGLLQPLLDRVKDAQQRFSSMPILPDIATSLEREVLVSSIYGTNTIEAGTITEQETAAALDLEPGQVKLEEQRRVSNIKQAYLRAENFAQLIVNNHGPQSCPLSEIYFKDLHRLITDGLTHPNNMPGEYRDNPKGLNTRMGDMAHGGVYQPPKCRDDIDLLMQAFIDWANSELVMGLDPLLRAPLIHYYFEAIHPFWDGNGRTGRVIEALVLKSAGLKYAPFAMSRYYLEHIDEYFSAFNQTRKAAEQRAAFPNTVFVNLFLNGMLSVMNKLHERANSMIGILLFGNQLRQMLDSKEINLRQYTIVSQLMNLVQMPAIQELQRLPWYDSLYKKLTSKTRSRDIQDLLKKGLLKLGENNRLVLGIPGR